MYTEEKLKRVNKIIKDMVFECEFAIFSGVFINIEFQFQIIGIKKMISVGDWHDFLVVNITIVDGDKMFDVLSKIKGSFITKDYKLLVNLNLSISNEMVYFFNDSQPRIHIPDGGVKLSDEYELNIKN